MKQLPYYYQKIRHCKLTLFKGSMKRTSLSDIFVDEGLKNRFMLLKLTTPKS